MVNKTESVIILEFSMVLELINVLLCPRTFWEVQWSTEGDIMEHYCHCRWLHECESVLTNCWSPPPRGQIYPQLMMGFIVKTNELRREKKPGVKREAGLSSTPTYLPKDKIETCPLFSVLKHSFHPSCQFPFLEVGCKCLLGFNSNVSLP